MSEGPLRKGAAPRNICGAKKRDGGQCHKAPVRGATRCRLHGGTQPVGVASPNWKHGRYSNPRYRLDPSTQLGEAYRRHLADPDYMALDQELALLAGQVDVVATELAGLRMLPERDVEVGGPCDSCGHPEAEHGDVLPEGAEQFGCLKFQPRTLRDYTENERLQRVLRIESLQARLGELLEQKRRMTEAEVHRVKAAQDNLSADTAKMLGHAMLVALREECGGDLALVARVQSRTVLILRSLGVRVA